MTLLRADNRNDKAVRSFDNVAAIQVGFRRMQLALYNNDGMRLIVRFGNYAVTISHVLSTGHVSSSLRFANLSISLRRRTIILTVIRRRLTIRHGVRDNLSTNVLNTRNIDRMFRHKARYKVTNTRVRPITMTNQDP